MIQRALAPQKTGCGAQGKRGKPSLEARLIDLLAAALTPIVVAPDGIDDGCPEDSCLEMLAV